jgi:hypothetical protein
MHQIEEDDDSDMDDDSDVDDDDDIDSEISVSETAEDRPLDPRAGLVDVDLPQLAFNAQGIAEAVKQQSQKCVRKKNRRILESLAEK